MNLVERKREELRSLYNERGIENISFWIRPDVCVSEEESLDEAILVLKNVRDGVGLIPANGDYL
jgi:hypothetical protein